MPKRRQRHPKIRPPEPESPSSTWRLFLAVPLPQEVTERVAGVVSELQRENWPVRWVATETIHITLAFLGEVAPERGELVRLALPGVVSRHKPFKLRTADFGVFPSWRRPRVLWVGCHGPTHRLETLEADVKKTLLDLEFELDPGEFRPHITLGRLREVGRSAVPVDEIRQRLEGADLGGQLTIPVEEVVLYRSFLGKGPTRHEPVARFPLSSPTNSGQ